jgi:hypothetical protein
MNTPLPPAVKNMFSPLPKIELDSQPATQMITQLLPSPKNHCYPSHNCSLPTHLKDYHIFTTVADNTYTDYPYCDATGKNVDLAIEDENMIAHVCHNVMLHTAESIFVGNPNNKKQYCLKAGRRKFASQGSMAIMKESRHLHTLKCFKPINAKQLSSNARRQALTSLIFLTEKCSDEVKAHACTNGSTQGTYVAKKEATASTVTSEAIFILCTTCAHKR